MKPKYRYRSFNPDMFECQVCKKMFKNNVGLNMHTKYVHKMVMESETECSRCGECFPSKLVGKHIAEHQKLDLTGVRHITSEKFKNFQLVQNPLQASFKTNPN